MFDQCSGCLWPQLPTERETRCTTLCESVPHLKQCLTFDWSRYQQSGKNGGAETEIVSKKSKMQQNKDWHGWDEWKNFVKVVWVFFLKGNTMLSDADYKSDLPTAQTAACQPMDRQKDNSSV